MGTNKKSHTLLKATALISVIVMSSLILVSYSFNFFAANEVDTRIKELENTLVQIKATISIDSVRQFYLQKVIALIERHNAAMPADAKYAIANEIYEMSIKYPNLDVDLICATISHESAYTWRTDVVSPAGAMGLMQIMPATGIFLAEAEGIQWTDSRSILFNPIYNIRLGCRYLSTLISLYDVDGGLAAYNGGERKASQWLQSGKNNAYLWQETREYIPAILSLYREYTR